MEVERWGGRQGGEGAKRESSRQGSRHLARGARAGREREWGTTLIAAEEGQRSGGTKGRSTAFLPILGRLLMLSLPVLATGDADDPANKAHNQRKNKSKREKGYLSMKEGATEDPASVIGGRTQQQHPAVHCGAIARQNSGHLGATPNDIRSFCKSNNAHVILSSFSRSALNLTNEFENHCTVHVYCRLRVLYSTAY